MAALRAGASDEELAVRWVAAMRGKRAGHGIDDPSFLQPDRPMSAIGGLAAAYSVRSAAGTTSFRKPRAPRKSDRADAVLVARQPGLAPVGGVQLRVVPEQRPDRGRRTALGRADRLSGSVIGAPPARADAEPSSSPVRASQAQPGREIGGAGRPRGKPSGTWSELRRGRLSSPARFFHGDAEVKCPDGLSCLRIPNREAVPDIRTLRPKSEPVGFRRCRRWPSPPRCRAAARPRRSAPSAASRRRPGSRPTKQTRPDRHRDDVAALPRGDVFVRGWQRRW